MSNHPQGSHVRGVFGRGRPHARSVPVLLAALLLSSPAVASDAEPVPEVMPAPAEGPVRPAPLRYDLAVDVPVAAGATVAWFTSELLKSHLAPSACRWCSRASDGSDTLNGFDRSVRNGLRWSTPGAADTASNVTAFALAPLAALGLDTLASSHDGAVGNAPVDGLLIAEATALAVDLNQAVKFAVGRERPFVHALAPVDKGKTAHPSDNNLSFYSGHTNLAFALATSSGTLASMRGYRWSPAVWVTGLTIASATGYLRIAADKHYASDVLVGAVVGSAVGVAVPWYFHRAAGRAGAPVVSGGWDGESGHVSAAWAW